MKAPRSLWRNLIVGTVLVLLATAVSVVIKEVLDTQNPESALPTMTVAVDGFDLPGTSVNRAGYEWNFFTSVQRVAPQLSQDDLPIVPYEVFRGSQLALSFNKKPKSFRVWRADGRYSTDYVELALNGGDVFGVPADTGIYVYRVLANWGNRGYIQYYFAVNVAG